MVYKRWCSWSGLGGAGFLGDEVHFTSYYLMYSIPGPPEKGCGEVPSYSTCAGGGVPGINIGGKVRRKKRGGDGCRSRGQRRKGGREGIESFITGSARGRRDRKNRFLFSASLPPPPSWRERRGGEIPSAFFSSSVVVLPEERGRERHATDLRQFVPRISLFSSSFPSQQG